MFVLIYNVDYFRSFIYGNNLSKYEWKELSSGDDLNEILGHYRTANNDIIKSLLNLPSAVTTGEITVDWYPVSYTSNFGTQMLRWTQNGESTIFSRAKYGSSTKWGAWVEYVTKDDLGKFLTASGSTPAKENSYATVTRIKLPAGHTYLVIGCNQASKTLTSIMSSQLIGFDSAAVTHYFYLGDSRTTGNSGGGCLCAAIVSTKAECTISLQGYGYSSGTYDYIGKLFAVQLA